MADIRDIQALSDLKAAFGRFGDDVLQILPGIQKQFEEVQERLEQRQRYWGQEVDRARDELHEARHSMHQCHRQAANSDDDDYVDCSFEEERVSEAERLLAEAEQNWEIVKQWRHRIESQIADFQNDIHRLSDLASTRSGSACSFLAGKLASLESYMVCRPPVIHGIDATIIADAALNSANRANFDALQLRGSEAEKSQLRVGFDALATTEIGRRLISVLNDLGTEVKFGQLENDDIAAFLRGNEDYVYNKIILSVDLMRCSPAIIATHLAHEATHVKWFRRRSLAQECDAYKTQAIVWIQLRGKCEFDYQNDRILGMMLDGEDTLKKWIMKRYSNLPLR